ncbi:hypothetical protein HY483_01985 [Candidatus Woesearchaeota archaeon]|nr:hypothetical protein [Candidatus Woesearchaeota archaeon]
MKEVSIGSNYQKYDSDDDGLGDGQELVMGRNYLKEEPYPSLVSSSDCNDCFIVLNGTKGSKTSLDYSQVAKGIFGIESEGITVRINGENDLPSVAFIRGVPLLMTLEKIGNSYVKTGSTTIVRLNRSEFFEEVNGGGEVYFSMSAGVEFVNYTFGGEYTRLFDEKKFIKEFLGIGILNISTSTLTIFKNPTILQKVRLWMCERTGFFCKL